MNAKQLKRLRELIAQDDHGEAEVKELKDLQVKASEAGYNPETGEEATEDGIYVSGRSSQDDCGGVRQSSCRGSESSWS